MRKYIKSPMNYTGGKYKLLPQILPYFPQNIATFVDLFAGGCNVAVNVEAEKIIANDYNREIIELYRFFQENDAHTLIKQIDALIEKFALSNTAKYGYAHYKTDSSRGVGSYNKAGYEKLRAAYNREKTPLLFYTTLLFAFNNQVRFNAKGDFNTPVNKRDFNKNLRKNFLNFVQRLNEGDIMFHSDDYREVEIAENAFVYIDPPYLATLAAYNENGGWSEHKEQELLEYMDRLHQRKIKFALSNVFENKGKRNELLIVWSKKYKVHYLDHSYGNCNYQSKKKSKESTIEVLITNY